MVDINYCDIQYSLHLLPATKNVHSCRIMENSEFCHSLTLLAHSRLLSHKTLHFITSLIQPPSSPELLPLKEFNNQKHPASLLLGTSPYLALTKDIVVTLQLINSDFKLRKEFPTKTLILQNAEKPNNMTCPTKSCQLVTTV